MKKGIRPHKKYGLNPTMTTCYYCNEASDILLPGADVKAFRDAGIPVREDGEMPHSVGVLDGRPCSKCEDLMKEGIIFISVRDDQAEEIEKANREKRLPNPHRTGAWVVVREDYVRRLIRAPEVLEGVLKRRMAFIPDQTWDLVGLPRGELSNIKIRGIN